MSSPSSPSPEPLTPAEWKIMKIVWEQGQGAARDVYQVAGKQFGWAPSTVKTILRRLVDKQFLKTSQIGNSFLYQPTRPVLKSLCGAADVLLERALDGTVGPLLAYMVKQGRLTPEELHELRGLIDELAPEET